MDYTFLIVRLIVSFVVLIFAIGLPLGLTSYMNLIQPLKI